MYTSDQFKPSRNRDLILQGLILLLFTTIGLRLWYFQIYKGQEYIKKAEANISRRQSLYAPRGLILDSQGHLLAENRPAYGLAIVREDCPDFDTTLGHVSQWTGIPASRLHKKLDKDRAKVKPFQPQLLISHLPFQELALIESRLLEWPELKIVSRPLRTYPQRDMLAHVLGYVALANEEELRDNPELQLGDNIGKQGIELAFDSLLRGTKGLKQLKVDAQGRELSSSVTSAPQPGQDLYLTIDLDLQGFAWQQLGSQAGSVVVMSPEDGRILSLVSKPGFDNNLFVRGVEQQKWDALRSHPRHPLQNRAIQSAYPPGSVFKLLMVSAALENRVFDLDKTVYCPGVYRLGRRLFRCWKKHGHGWLDMREAIKQSCDVYFYTLGHEMGVDLISSYALENGFGTRTGIELPNEARGLIPTREWKLRRFGESWQGGETINMSIGQGYTLVTPLQVARFVSALVNGGHLLKPLLVQSREPVVQKELGLSETELDFIREAMIATVEEPHGTAWRLRTQNATIGGKTGTAQVVKLKEEDREKETEEIRYKFRDHAWMASFGHIGEQSYVVVVLVEHGGHGSSAAGPVVKAIYDYLVAKEG